MHDQWRTLKGDGRIVNIQTLINIYNDPTIIIQIDSVKSGNRVRINATFSELFNITDEVMSFSELTGAIKMQLNSLESEDFCHLIERALLVSADWADTNIRLNERSYILQMTSIAEDMTAVVFKDVCESDLYNKEETSSNYVMSMLQTVETEGLIGVYTYDTKRQVVALSKTAKSIIGIEAESTWSDIKTIKDQFEAEDGILFTKWVKSCVAGEHKPYVIVRYKHLLNDNVVTLFIRGTYKKGYLGGDCIIGTIDDVSHICDDHEFIDDEYLRSRVGSMAAKLAFFRKELPEGRLHLDAYFYEIAGGKESTFLDCDSFRRNIHPDDKVKMKSLMANLEIDEAYKIEFRYYNEQLSRYIWIKEVGIPLKGLRDKDNQVILGAYQNIDEEKRNQEEIKQLVNLLNIGMKNGKIDIWDYDMTLSQVVLRTNHRDAIGLDGTYHEFHISDLLDRIYQQDRKYFEATIRNLRQTTNPEFTISFRYVDKKDHSLRWFKVIGKVTEYSDRGKPTRCVGIAQDITTYYINEEKLRLSKERLRQASHLAHLGSWDYSEKTQMIELLDGVHEILGISKFDDRYLISKKDFVDFVVEEDRDKIREIFNLDNRWLQYDEQFYAVIDKNKKKLQIIATYKYDRNGNLQNIIGTIQDITEMNALEQALRQAEKMTAVGQLAGGIAHDFNNILMATSGYTELIKIKSDKPEVQNYCDKIAQSIQRSTDLTKKLLAFSRKDSLIKKPIHLHGTVNNAIGIISRTIDKKVEIIMDFDVENDLVFADATEIQNVIMNLSLNARDAMPYGGSITIATKSYEVIGTSRFVNEVELTVGKYIMLTVEDTGFGIDKSHIGKIFDPFFTTKEVGKGTGLGLSAAFGTILSHGGAIEVESAMGIGTKFSLYFPLHLIV